MASQTGRAEKRIHWEVPMRISRLQKPGPTALVENTTTENVSPNGARVLISRALPPQERLLVTSLIGNDEAKLARVVYCEPLAEGVFGVGLQFEKGKQRLKTVLPTCSGGVARRTECGVKLSRWQH
jgi:hypothetical protein